MRVIASVVIFASVAASCSAWARDEIIVSVVRGETSVRAATVYELDSDDLLDIRATSLSDALSRAPSASLQTNSRGETLAFFRGAGERQTALFFDGASLNIPWDNRLDIALVPSRAAAQISTTPGVSSVLYGANTSGGVIDINPVSANTTTSFDVQGGEGGFLDGGAVFSGGGESWRGVAAAGFTHREGATLTRDANIAFSQADSSLRTNTDLSRLNGFARLETELGRNHSLSASILAIDVDYGIAPEGHLDPGDNSVRFWRYPKSRHIVGVINATIRPTDDLSIRNAVWVQQFNQTIESYSSGQYAQIDDLQTDSDRTYGARVVAENTAGVHLLRGVVTIVDARHRQTDVAFTNGVAPDVAPPPDRFHRRTVSVGGEYELSRGVTRLSLGVSGDFLQTLDTGGRPEAGDFATWNLIGGIEHELDDRWSIAFSAGRKTRLPTQRELFGTAIDRFLINPDLKAESAILIEAPVRYADDRLSFTVAPFTNLSTNTIDQRNVIVDNLNLRQRINLRGSRNFGVEVFGEASLTERLSVAGNLTAMRLRRLPENDALDERFLSERPQVLARASLSYVHPNGLRGSVEAQYRGRAFSLDQNNVFIPLARSTSFNAEISYGFSLADSAVNIFLRADNFTDTLIEPQLGLPVSGRVIRGGLRVSAP
ncbi:TonB-dependent receptor [Hyphococcus flavus]|uniref:TonB-dependent receptor n=1 Tax=Hyphococcus flavus TaxID=1866326 RepID=A0AAF0CFR2_9PROT|nr:TonB-dependent receptor [Hyphococcus flavus]WDI31318.1 TonB-dependent receptor [Hyphococcus flavus]